jgi:hypothetical protein
MAARAGIEPVVGFLQACVEAIASVSAHSLDTQIRTQRLNELLVIVEAWPKLSPELRTACLAVTRAADLGSKLTRLSDVAQPSD